MGKHMEDVREMLCEELDRFGEQNELSAGSLDTIDKLSHAIKSIDTIMAMEESGYSKDGRYSSYDDNSYARMRRDSRGRYSRGRSYNDGRYSYDDGVVEQLHDIMESAPDSRTKKAIQEAIKKIGE